MDNSYVNKYWGSYEVMLDKNLVETTLVKRTWKERLFTFPFNPFKKYKQIYIPSKKFYIIGMTIVMHPSVYEELKAKIGVKDEQRSW